MKMQLAKLLAILQFHIFGVAGILFAEDPIVIAHRGASGYLPEHTIAAKTLAVAQGADFIEQDVVLSKDDHAIVMHDIHCDTTTNVREVFPERSRSDGRFYVRDFTLSELKQLRVNERIDLKTGKQVYIGRFPSGKSHFQVVTLAEEIELLVGLNSVLGKQIGLYIELKAPKWHHQQGGDLAKVVLSTLKTHRVAELEIPLFLQCFELEENRRLKNELECQFPLIQLIGSRNAKLVATQASLAELSKVAVGIGPPIDMLMDTTGAKPQSNGLVQRAHQEGLLVHPYTLRADSLPSWSSSLEQCFRVLHSIGIDGVFTDHPDLAVSALESIGNK